MALTLLVSGSTAHAQTVNGFSSFTTLNGGATDTATALTLTTDLTNQARSSFSSALVNYGAGFTASFTYTPSGSKTADGIAFILQNDSRGLTALGASGASLGYGGLGGTLINNSAAVELNIFSTNTVGTAFGTNGTTGSYTALTPGTGINTINLASGDPINVTLTYSSSANTLTEAITDPSGILTGTYTKTFSNVNLPSAVGGSGKAYVGFSGGTGSSTSTQTVSNFTFTGAAAPEPGSVALLVFGAIGGLPLVGGIARRHRRRAA